MSKFINKTRTTSINGDKTNLDVMHRSPALSTSKADKVVSQTSETTRNIKFHILIAEDEPMTRKILTLSLERLGYGVTAAKNGLEALVLFEEQQDRDDANTKFDLVLLDGVMPKMDGFTACAEIRQRSDIPIIMLTALNAPDDMVRGLEMGADSYITKPFAFKEVEARIRALLRRTSSSSSRRTTKKTFNVVQKGSVKLNKDTREVTVGQTSSMLTKTEYILLNYLMTNENIPLSKQNLLEHVWGYQSAGSENLVELAIRRLRKKIEENPSSPTLLKTVRGVGYQFCPIQGVYR
ncbi:MAG: response regulator transcription factor [Chloroflexota bacterium]